MGIKIEIQINFIFDWRVKLKKNQFNNDKKIIIKRMSTKLKKYIWKVRIEKWN